MTEYKTPSVTADIFIFDEEINFILVKRKNNPFRDYWALPGGFVEYGESVENGAIREAKEDTKTWLVFILTPIEIREVTQ